MVKVIMNNHKDSPKIIRRWLASMLVIIFMVMCVVIGYRTGSNFERYYSTAVINMNSGWLSEDGSTLSLNDLPQSEITLEHSVADFDLKEKRLCMKSIDTFFELLADGNVIYSYFPDHPGFLGRSYGMYIHMIPVPENTSTLTLKLTPIFPGAPPAVLNTVIEDPGVFMGDLFKDGMPGFCLCFIMLILGLIMITIGIFSYHKIGNQPIEFFTLGIFAVLVAAWSVNDTLILQVLTQNPAMIRLMNYMTLIFLPYFIVSFIATATNNHKTKILPVLFVIICINFMLNILLTTTGVSDYFKLVRISQLVILIAIIMAVYLIVYAIRKNQVEKKFLRSFLVGIGALVIGAGIDLIRFRVITNVLQVTSLYARIGSLMFLIIIGLYLIQENSRLQYENSRALEQLAYIDGLTGLKNRLAFNEAESSLLSDPEARCIIIQFDVNNLKKVNDLYGHAEGDKHIGGAADIIRNSIRDTGECYRTGGDEFTAIITKTDDETTAQEAISNMEKLIEEYNCQENPPVLLDIAYGMAPYRAAEGSLKSAELLADKRMYECKRIKKLEKASL